ncbi:Transcriptional regulator, PadR family [Caenispirillum salinarum AK4]|uniref:Transcriptional regulator, PadR family n=1 Tax=Caenispirillum salinarum AK4 TaxID=1238182 RepID=K9GU62_9PROT|nr:PadR family transcriptional regulator [Caenispirillum salinarum]EKV28687.1 Transcriptional regulator, PadR family [Caenispirillum salinarum AK4]
MDAKTLCLGALARGPASGYEIRKMFEEGAYAAFHPIGFGSIYPALTALLAEGLVACQEEPQAGRPDKKVYTLTPEGHAALVRSFASNRPAVDKYKSDTLFMLSLAEVMEPDRVRRLVADYKDLNASELEKMAECDPADMTAGQRFVFGLGKAVYSAIATYIDNNAGALVDSLERGDHEPLPGRSAGETAPHRARKAGE